MTRRRDDDGVRGRRRDDDGVRGRRLVTVVGSDRPGLIASVSGILADVGADLEEVTMTRLEGNFTMILLSRGGDEARIRDELDRLADRENLSIHVENAVPRAKEPEPDLFIQALGPNRTGIVARLSRILAERKANIVEMTTRLLESAEPPIYIVRIEAVAGSEAEAVRTDLAEAARALGVEIRVEALERADL